MNRDSTIEWDASMPGAGAQRVTAITQLYFRMAGYGALTVLVADALCYVFAEDGATTSELADYLGLAEERVSAALEAIPAELRCTSRDLQRGDDAPTDVRHYLNYKLLLPTVYAHLTHMLLALCIVPLPRSSYTERVARTQLGHSAAQTRDGTAPTIFLRAAPPQEGGRGDGATNGEGGRMGSDTQPPSSSSLTTSLLAESEDAANVSLVLRQREALEGIYCAACRSYSALQEFAPTLSRCPVCHVDVLRATLESIKRRMDDQCAQGGSLVSLLPGQRASLPAPQARGTETSKPAATKSQDAKGAALRADTTFAETPLARDPFLVQQALAFVFLYATPFAYVNDARCIVKADDILTGAEYERRLQGKVSIADEFRAAHRNPATVHVRLLAQADVDAAKRAANARKLAKRTHLPPWLRHYSLHNVLYSSNGPSDPPHSEAPPAYGDYDVAEPPATRSTAADLTRAARFIAKLFYDDDFDDDALAQVALRRHK